MLRKNESSRWGGIVREEIWRLKSGRRGQLLRSIGHHKALLKIVKLYLPWKLTHPLYLASINYRPCPLTIKMLFRGFHPIGGLSLLWCVEHGNQSTNIKKGLPRQERNQYRLISGVESYESLSFSSTCKFYGQASTFSVGLYIQEGRLADLTIKQ